MPLTTSGSDVWQRSHSTSDQLSDGSKVSAVCPAMAELPSWRSRAAAFCSAPKLAAWMWSGRLKPHLRSRSLRPITGMSAVSMRAPTPAASARWISSRVWPRSRSQYSWSHRAPPTAATSSSATLLSIGRTKGTPARLAARAIAFSPSGCSSFWYAIGAIARGSAQASRSSSPRVLRRLTSASTRGTSRIARSASVLR